MSACLRECACTQPHLPQAGANLPAAVAVLYSETADVWQTTAGTYGASLRTLYIALKHAQLPVDIVIEEDCVAGRLHYYDVLYVALPMITDAAAEAIAAWVANGGTVYALAGGGLLNQANQTNTAMEALLGIQLEENAAYVGTQDPFNATIRLIKQDVNFVQQLDQVTMSPGVGVGAGPACPTAQIQCSYGTPNNGCPLCQSCHGGMCRCNCPAGDNTCPLPPCVSSSAGTTNSSTPMVVKGMKTMFKVAAAAGVGADGNTESPPATPAPTTTTLATFGDGSPALIRTAVGKGAAYFAAFMPGVAYFAPAIPLRPVDRSSVDEVGRTARP